MRNHYHVTYIKTASNFLPGAAVVAGLPPRPLQPLLPPPPTAPASDLEVRPGRGRRARRRGASVRRSACAAAEGAAASGGVCGAWWGLNYRASPRPQPKCSMRGRNYKYFEL